MRRALAGRQPRRAGFHGGYRRAGLAAAAWLALAAAPAEAAFESLGSGARAVGMGDAFTAVADDVHAHYYNPAGLAGLDRPQFSAAYSRLHAGLSDGSELSVSQLAYAQPLRRGAAGTLAAAWHELKLAGLYGERSLYLSYGRRLVESERLGSLSAGVSLKHLTLSFERPANAARSFCSANPLDQSCGADPVLSGDSAKSVPDLDLGLLYRFRKRWSAGLAVAHLNEPDLAFSASDSAPLTRGLRLGLGYRALWMNLASELRLERAPGGGSDKSLLLGAERYFPSLRGGQFGLRAGLGLGSRDFRQVTAGLSYRINKIQLDYAFLMPLGTVKGTAGTHRMGLTFHFGAPTPEEEHEARLLEKMEALRGPRAGYAYEFADLPSPVAPILAEERFTRVSSAIAASDYAAAYAAVAEPLLARPGEVAAVALAHRLEEVSRHFPRLDPGQGPWTAALDRSLKAFLHGRDEESALLAGYALSLNPGASGLAGYVARLEEVTKRPVERVPEGSAATLLQLKLNESEALFLGRRLDEAIRLCQEILLLEPGHATALARLGSAHYVAERLGEAVGTWEKALEVETRGSERETIRYMLAQAKRRIAEAGRPKPKPRPAPAPAPKPADPEALERLYQRAVELYSGGDWQKAAETFQKILELDPGNRQAARALKRLEAERMSIGGRP